MGLHCDRGVAGMNRLIQMFISKNESSDTVAARSRLGEIAGVVGIVSNLLLFAVKLISGLWAGSIAIVADAVNNLSDSVSSIAVIVGFRISKRPADSEHPYGHARIEYIAGVIISFVIVFLGLQFIRTSFDKIRNPQTTFFSVSVLIVLILSIALKLWQSLFYRSVGKQIASETLMAAAVDSRNDVINTSVVLLGAVISKATGYELDGYLGLAVAVLIVISGVRMVMETANPLLGIAPDKAMTGMICEKVMSYDGIIGVHDLEVHSYGSGVCYATIHCEVPAEENIMKSHDIIDEIERDFDEIHGIRLVIHMDPVLLGDERTNQLRGEATREIQRCYPDAAIHDFRVVWGIKHVKILFDVAVPYEEDTKDDRILHQIEQVLLQLVPNAVCVIRIDRVPR